MKLLVLVDKISRQFFTNFVFLLFADLLFQDIAIFDLTRNLRHFRKITGDVSRNNIFHAFFNRDHLLFQ